MSAFWNDWKHDLLDRRTGAMWGFATLVAAITGPMGSYENCSFEHRLVLWGLWIGLFVVIGTAARAFVHAVLNLRDFHRGGMLTAVLVACGVAFPVSAMNVMEVLPATEGPYLNAGLAEIAALVFLMNLAITAHLHFGREVALPVAPPQSEVAAEAPAVPMPRIVQRLEPALQGPLVALSVRDHYVEVQTMAGRGTVLMRFGDAVAEVAPVEGAQVHRSHWVAWDRVARVVREDGRLFLEMAEGPPIPVSRNHRDRLVERGLI